MLQGKAQILSNPPTFYPRKLEFDNDVDAELRMLPVHTTTLTASR
jgi:hypothetical protein